MILSEPTLILKRMIVKKDRSTVYDEVFHEGVNVISGENSSGKSTVLNFLFYGLGGDLSVWSKVALLCTEVFVEIELNGHTATLNRQISSKAGQPMDLFGGPYALACNAPKSEWSRYPYRLSQGKESFSQALFRLLKIPEVKTDLTGNVTMHQILRLLYADQLTPVDNIFKSDSFDQALLREAVGRLLCGAYDSKLYNNEITIKQSMHEIDIIEGELKSLYKVIGKSQTSMNAPWLEQQTASLKLERETAQLELLELDKLSYTSNSNIGLDRPSLETQSNAYKDVQSAQAKIVELKKARDATLLSIEDGAAFINSLEAKIDSLKESITAFKYLGNVQFNSCPACHTAIEDKHKDDNSICPLCKSNIDISKTEQRIVELVNDTALQIKQSKLLYERRKDRLKEIKSDLLAAEAKWETAAHTLSEAQQTPSNARKDKAQLLQRKIGYIDRALEDIKDKMGIILLVDELSGKQQDIKTLLDNLRTDNEKLSLAQADNLRNAQAAIIKEVLNLIHNDLRREDTFEHAKDIDFSFSSNTISVDGERYFSASSRAILRSSFFLGFLAAATQNDTFRHPKFIILDTIEDKGMEPDRSRNFQNLIKLVSDNALTTHQIIYATAMIAPDLNDEKYIVGKHSTRDNPTINILT